MLPLYADGVTTAVSRREFLSALSASAAFAKAPPLPAPWNFVFVLMDDLGWADIGPFANHVIDTPNLNRFASQSVRFTNAYAACPVCSPTRASILTGRYPARFHLTDWIPGRKQWPYAKLLVPQFAQNLPKQEVTFAEKLKGRGYRSAAIGKWHLGGAGFLPTDQGFDLNIAGNAAGSPPSYFGPLELPGLTLKNGEFLTDRLINEANRFIRTNASNPFCLYLAHFTVHLPLEAPKELVDKYRRKKTGDIDPVYCAMVESADAALGNLLEAVDASPNAQRTVVIFFSDNGGVRFQERRPKPVTTNAPLRAGKGHLYEGGIREPLLIRWPGVAREGITLLTPVSSIDFFPTICATAGLSAGTVDGVDLAPLFRGQSLPERPLFWHYPHYSDQGGVPSGAVRLGNWKLIEFFEDNRLELFNLSEDRGETRNLVHRETVRAAKLHDLLRDWRRSVRASMPKLNSAYDPARASEGLTGYEKATPPA